MAVAAPAALGTVDGMDTSTDAPADVPAGDGVDVADRSEVAVLRSVIVALGLTVTALDVAGDHCYSGRGRLDPAQQDAVQRAFNAAGLGATTVPSSSVHLTGLADLGPVEQLAALAEVVHVERFGTGCEDGTHDSNVEAVIEATRRLQAAAPPPVARPDNAPGSPSGTPRQD